MASKRKLRKRMRTIEDKLDLLTDTLGEVAQQLRQQPQADSAVAEGLPLVHTALYQLTRVFNYFVTPDEARLRQQASEAEQERAADSFARTHDKARQEAATAAVR